MHDLAALAWVCGKAGLVAFGGGTGMIPLLHADVVLNHHWLTEREFLDGVALGKMTPGPIMVAATFVGWKVAGLTGAIVATIGVFAPSALLTVLAGWQLRRLRDSPWLKGFLAGVLPAVVGLVAAVVVQLGRVALALPAGAGYAGVDYFALVLCGVALAILMRSKVDASLLVLAGAVLGLVWY
jgi:chromate transporter